jgi:hypothetical protein
MAPTEQGIPLPRAALEAKLSAEQMRRRILRGEITATQVAGRYWLVEAASLRAWIAQHSREPAPAA